MKKPTLQLNHKEYVKEYGVIRTTLVKDAAGDLARELQHVYDEQPIGKERRIYDMCFTVTALFNHIKEVKRWKNNPMAMKGAMLKQLLDAPKWNLLNPVYFATMGGLKVMWDQNHCAKANQVFEGKWGQDKALMLEHVYPTKVLKERMFVKGFATIKQLVYYVAQRNILSYTSAEENKLLPTTKMVDTSNFFDRYDQVGLITYPLRAKWSKFNRDNVYKKLAKDALSAQKMGKTFKEWAESVIYTH